jgi:hypothetical protein
MLAVDGAGHVYGMAVPTSDHKVLYDVSDAIPGFLGVKVVPGAGIAINVTTDGTNGKVMHINVNQGSLNSGVQILGKSFSSSGGITTTGIAQSIIGMHSAPIYGSFTLPANSVKVGDTYRINVQTPQATNAWYCNINLFADTGGGFSGNIQVPAGCTEIEFCVTFDDITYGANAGFYFFINSPSGLLAGAPGGYGIFDCATDQTFTVTATTWVTAAAINPFVSLWKE